MVSSANGYSLPKKSLSIFFSLNRSGVCLSIFPAIEDAMVGCAMLGLSEASFMFDLMDLCEVLNLPRQKGGKTYRIPLD